MRNPDCEKSNLFQYMLFKLQYLCTKVTFPCICAIIHITIIIIFISIIIVQSSSLSFFLIILQSICLPTCPPTCPYVCHLEYPLVDLFVYHLIQNWCKKTRKREKWQFSILFFFKGTSGQALQKKNPSWTCNFPFPVALLPPTINQVKMIIKHQSSILMSMKQRRRNMQLMKIWERNTVKDGILLAFLHRVRPGRSRWEKLIAFSKGSLRHFFACLEQWLGVHRKLRDQFDRLKYDIKGIFKLGNLIDLFLDGRLKETLNSELCFSIWRLCRHKVSQSTNKTPAIKAVLRRNYSNRVSLNCQAPPPLQLIKGKRKEPQLSSKSSIAEHILKVLISSFYLHLQRRSDRNHEKLSQIARQVQVMSSRHGLTKEAATMTAAARKLARGRVISGRGLHLDKVYCVLYQTF